MEEIQPTVRKRYAAAAIQMQREGGCCEGGCCADGADLSRGDITASRSCVNLG